MSPFASPSPRQIDLGLLVLRVIAGITFTAHGAQKIFVFGFDGLAQVFAGMGIPLPMVAAPLVAILELLGGMALIAGALTRLTSVGLAITMLGAIGFAHLSAGFFGPNGYEFPLVLLAVSATLALVGAGKLSVDGVIEAKSRS